MDDLWKDLGEREIVHRDDDILVVDKPAGVPGQTTESRSKGQGDDLVTRLKRFLGQERGVPPDQVYLGEHQRLDQATSGLVLFALRREVNGSLAEQFEGRKVVRRYTAAVAGKLGRSDEITLRDRIAKGKGGAMRVAGPRERGARDAVTRLRVLRRVRDRALLSLQLETGRTHPVRVQLAHAGAPIVGDRMYGGRPATRLMLHASELSLQHPRDGRALSLRSEPPPELSDFVLHGGQDVLAERGRFVRALDLALETRYSLGHLRDAVEPTTAFRLFHRAGDGADGLALDLYGEYLVVHLFEELPADRLQWLLDVLDGRGVRGVYLKRHPRQKNELGAAGQRELAPGEPARGQGAPGELVVHEHGMPLGVRLGDGFSTGLFLDQRDNRRRVRERASGKRVLNLFAYTGGFSVAALAGGAQAATCVDASKSALEQARLNVARIAAGDRHRVMVGDVFDTLARLARRGEMFDLLVLDPPSYSTTRSRRFRVLKDYAELVELCAAVMAPGAELLACINHHGAGQGWLRREVRRGLEAAGRAIEGVRDLPPGLDFPAVEGQEPDAKSVLVKLKRG